MLLYYPSIKKWKLKEREVAITNKNEPAINDNIRALKVRLIDENGKQLGITSKEDALNRALKLGLDLIEISPDADPPVCKILDYGKYRYEKQRQHKLNKKKQHVIHVKEIRVRPNIGIHDLETKLKKGHKFLLNGDKLKITVMFRGREMSRKEAGLALLQRVTSILEEIAEIDKESSLEGRRLSIILRPR